MAIGEAFGSYKEEGLGFGVPRKGRPDARTLLETSSA
jgi:hypothetical protein